MAVTFRVVSQYTRWSRPPVVEVTLGRLGVWRATVPHGLSYKRMKYLAHGEDLRAFLRDIQRALGVALVRLFPNGDRATGGLEAVANERGFIFVDEDAP